MELFAFLFSRLKLAVSSDREQEQKLYVIFYFERIGSCSPKLIELVIYYLLRMSETIISMGKAIPLV